MPNFFKTPYCQQFRAINMKKSNKILAGIFLTVFLGFLGIHIALYANLSAGNYTLYKDAYNEKRITHALPNVKYVSLRLVREATIYASDTSRIQFGNDQDEKAFTFRMQQDTLVVMGKDTSAKEINWNGTVLIGVPDGAVVQADQSFVVLRGRSGTEQKSSFTINANASELRLDTEETAPFETLTITATDKAQIHLSKARINKLDATLKDAYLDEDGARIDSITLTADATSRILFTGPNFLKTKPKTSAAHE